MIAIADNRIPNKAKENLAKYAHVIEFKTKGIVYEAISGHPDIFFFKNNDRLIVAPNLPSNYFNLLDKYSVNYTKGDNPVGMQYPNTAIYNAVSYNDDLIHNLEITDPSILNSSIKTIHINQGYSRCNLIFLKDNHFITSDKGILNTLSKKNFTGLYIEPTQIILNDMPYGFFGGACGILNDTFFLLGSLRHLKEKNIVFDMLKKLNYEIIELYDGPIVDGGSILFLA